MLSMFLQPQTQGAGQNMPGSTPSTTTAQPAPAGPPPSGGPSAQFASNTLANLIATQEQSSTSGASQDLASQMLKQLDTDGDGELSEDEIKTALGQNPASGSDAANALDKAIGQLDTDGDGKLSANELSAGLDAEKASQTAQATDTAQTAPKPHGHHHHHGGGASSATSSSDLAANLIGGADSDGDGALSLAEIESALGSTSSGSNNGLSQMFAKADSNGDGTLSSTELSSAIDAFRGAHHRGGSAPTQAAPTGVTA